MNLLLNLFSHTLPIHLNWFVKDKYQLKIELLNINPLKLVVSAGILVCTDPRDLVRGVTLLPLKKRNKSLNLMVTALLSPSQVEAAPNHAVSFCVQIMKMAFVYVESASMLFIGQQESLSKKHAALWNTST